MQPQRIRENPYSTREKNHFGIEKKLGKEVSCVRDLQSNSCRCCIFYVVFGFQDRRWQNGAVNVRRRVYKVNIYFLKVKRKLLTRKGFTRRTECNTWFPIRRRRPHIIDYVIQKMIFFCNIFSQKTRWSSSYLELLWCSYMSYSILK